MNGDQRQFIIAIIVLLVIIVIGYYTLKYFSIIGKKEEQLIIKPDDDKIPILRMLKDSFWVEPGETPMLLRILTERKLRWYGLTNTDMEMQYEIIDPLTMVVHTPALEDFYKAPGFYRLEAINENTIKMTIIKGMAHSAPLYLHRVSPIKTFLSETY